jgi:hypothetical protein
MSASTRYLAPVLVVLAAVAFSWNHWSATPRWTVDGLYYEAQRLELGGASAQEARRQVFFDDERYADARHDAFGARAIRPDWVDYSATFYRRRWLDPAIAAALGPAFGTRSLLLVSLGGFVACGLLLYLLLRTRFSAVVAAVVSVAALALQPLEGVSFVPLTDSTGLALLFLAILAGYRALNGSWRWVALWAATLGLLSVTRDSGIVVLVAMLVMAAVYRSRRALVLLATGVAAALPVTAVFRLPVREEVAYTLNWHEPTNAGWGWIAMHYPGGLAHAVAHDLIFAVAHPATGLFFLVGAAGLAATIGRADRYRTLLQGCALGGLAFLLANPNPGGSDFRLELVLLPAAAVGLAVALEGVLARRFSLRTESTEPTTA